MPVYLDLQCVLFFKTTRPIVPVDFVQWICEDAKDSPVKRKMRFVNRLTPMALMGKATEKGLEEVGRVVVGEHFQLADTEADENLEKEKCLTVSKTLSFESPRPNTVLNALDWSKTSLYSYIVVVVLVMAERARPHSYG
jgi:hypothetical protein